VTCEGDLAASAGGVFTLTALYYGQGWQKPGRLLAYKFEPPVALNTSYRFGSGRDAGSLTGAFSLATITVAVSPTAKPGSYMLKLSHVAGSDKESKDVQVDATGSDYVVTIVDPNRAAGMEKEPGTATKPAAASGPAVEGKKEPGPKAGEKHAAPTSRSSEARPRGVKETRRKPLAPARSPGTCGAGIVEGVIGSAIGLLCLVPWGRRDGGI
jgi:hypothetical protein